MMEKLIIFSYIMVAYALSNAMIYSSGPFNIFGKLRSWADLRGGQIGVLFNCMMCLPTYIGMVLSLLNWFLIPVPLTPFNIFLNGTNLFPVAMILDGLLTSGVVWLLYSLDEFLSSANGSQNDNDEDKDDNKIEIL